MAEFLKKYKNDAMMAGVIETRQSFWSWVKTDFRQQLEALPDRAAVEGELFEVARLIKNETPANRRLGVFELVCCLVGHSILRPAFEHRIRQLMEV